MSRTGAHGQLTWVKLCVVFEVGLPSTHELEGCSRSVTVAHCIVVGARRKQEGEPMSLARLSWLSIIAHILCDRVCQLLSTLLVRWSSGAEGRTWS
jgi:hypothetical protein